MIRKSWFKPVIAGILQDRLMRSLLLAAISLQLSLNLFGLPGWACPIKAAVGIACPGCGLTSAVVELLRGDWRHALATHAFAPIFLLAGLTMAVVAILPTAQRNVVIAKIASFEQRTGIAAWVLISMLIYWLLRLSGLIQAG